MHTSNRARKPWRTSLLVLVLPLTGCAANTGGFGSRPGGDEEGLWAIRCATLRGENRLRLAESCAAALKHVDGLNPELVTVFHADGQSMIYYGRYRREFDAARNQHRFKPDHMSDLALIRSLSVMVDGRPSWPFRRALPEELPTKRSRNPAWDLANMEGYYSLQVAVFYNDLERGISGRRFLAEEYCRELREQGYEAYYHHGQVRYSIVCVGLFPKSAVRAIQSKAPLTGALVVTNKIVDRRVLELQRRFPYNLKNGSRRKDVIRNPRTGQTLRIPHESFLVIVPRAEQAERRLGGG